MARRTCPAGNHPRRFAMAAVLLIVIELVAASAAADHRKGHGSIRHSGEYRDRQRIELQIEIDDRNALRLQREAIAAREEADREKARQLRRNELEKEREAAQTEFLELREDVRASSRAARRAPRDFYFRRPGFETSVLPEGSLSLRAGEAEYQTFQGIFFRSIPAGYVVVTAPVGALVERPPAGSTAVRRGDEVYYYYFGTFYKPAGRGYTVVSPPSGMAVPYLPDGYDTEHVDGNLQYRFGAILYRPFYREGIIVYVVTEG